MFSEMIRASYAKGTKVLVLTDRIELFTQTMNVISHHQIVPQMLNANTKIFHPEAPVTMAMVETIKRRMKSWTVPYTPDLVIIDEAHRGNFTSIIDAFPNAFIIGATATVIGKHFFKYYTNIVQNIDIPELVEKGYLCRCLAYQMQDDFSDVKITRGEFDEGELFAHFNKSKLYAGVVEKYKEKSMGKQCLVFNCNIEHANLMSKEFNDAGIQSEVVTSKTPTEERKRILSAFESGHFPVLNNCGILVAGYDNPKIETIIVNRATTSLALWLQMQGRGSRPYNGKNQFMVLDFGQNHARLGLWAEAREWKLEEPKKKKKGVAPVRNCPSCHAMLAASARKCEFCGHLFPKEERVAVNGVLVEIKTNIPVGLENKRISQLTIEELIACQKVKKYKASFCWRVMRSRGEEALREYAKLMKYESFWLKTQIDKIEDNKYSDYIIK